MAAARPFEVTDRPLVARRTLGVWLVCLVAAARGAWAYANNVALATSAPYLRLPADAGVNYRVFHVAAETARAGGNVYAATPPDAGAFYAYLYPPITVVAYYPFTLVDRGTGHLLLTLLSLAACLAATRAIVRYVEARGVRLGWVDVAGVLGLVVASVVSYGTFYYGNVNLLLAWLFVVGFVALDRDGDGVAGVAFGLAALWKLFPALVGVWLLRRRAWRAVGAATATGLAGVLAGLLAFGPAVTRRYFLTVVPRRSATAAFVGGYPADATYYVTLQRPLSHLLWSVWPDAPAPALVVLAALVAAGALGVFYRDVATDLERLFALCATVLVVVTVAPSLQWYLALAYLPLVALLFCWRAGPGRRLFLLGVALLFVGGRPDRMVGILETLGLPGAVETPLVGLASVATLQTYGVVLVLLGCAWGKYGGAVAAGDGRATRTGGEGSPAGVTTYGSDE